jgi:hypothetical protein
VKYTAATVRSSGGLSRSRAAEDSAERQVITPHRLKREPVLTLQQLREDFQLHAVARQQTGGIDRLIDIHDAIGWAKRKIMLPTQRESIDEQFEELTNIGFGCSGKAATPLTTRA